MQTTQPLKGVTQTERKNIYMNRMVKQKLGSAYSWRDELYYIGNPCVAGATAFEEKTIAAIERNWKELTTI